MDNASPDLFGFELLQKLFDNQITKKEHILILFIHWYLTKNGFRCIGTGDSKAFNATDKGSELLPDGWNQQLNYALRYLKDGKLYILHGTKSDEDLLINLLRNEDHNVATIQFLIEQTVKELHGTVELLIPSYKTVMYTVQNDLIAPVYPGNTREVSIQTTATREQEPRRSDDNPLRVETPRPSSRIQPWSPENDPTNVGRADLDPFAQGGGGMIYDPFTPAMRNPLDSRQPGGLGVPGRLPPGAVPPGARFYPFGPPDVNPRRPPRGPENFPGSDDSWYM